MRAHQRTRCAAPVTEPHSKPVPQTDAQIFEKIFGALASSRLKRSGSSHRAVLHLENSHRAVLR